MPTRRGVYRRIELRVVAADPLLAELDNEAQRRGVPLQQHLYDLLRARYLARQGDTLAACLWVPEGAAPPVPPEQTTARTDQTAQAAAAAWLDLLDEGNEE